MGHQLNAIQAILLVSEFDERQGQRILRVSETTSAAIRNLPFIVRVPLRVGLSIIWILGFCGSSSVRAVVRSKPAVPLRRFVVGVAAVSWFSERA